MQRKSWAGAAAIGVLLAGCGGSDIGGTSQPDSGAVPLATTADALRELGNTIAAVRLVQTPLPGACSSGGDTVTGPASKSRAFVYYNTFTGTVVYETHNYSACVQSSNATTLDGLLEAGATADGAYAYAVRGSPTAVLLVRSSGVDGSGTTVSIAQSLVGTIETHTISGTQSEVRSGLQTQKTQTPTSGGSATYQNLFAVGVNGPTFDVLSDSSGNGGNGSETIAGSYNYNSTVCSGGTALAATPSALLLTPSADGSYRYATGGTLTVSAGANSVSYTFSASGATLSGSVSGSLSSSEVQQAFGTGSGC